ncbi:major facilitator superfamily domain-containing protein [Bisporella sp. PMI_857]|nr:major facilitator superfamily domain-containing protein [Bisporella sp. PMI_857]
MQISKESAVVGIIDSVYYRSCAVGAVIASRLADKKGRKVSIFACLTTTVLGNLFMFTSGLTTSGASAWNGWALARMFTGRVIIGLGDGGIDAVIPVYSSKLASDHARGKALAQEFQMNIFGFCLVYAINLGVTLGLGKDNQWAWRIPIMAMQFFPILLVAFIAQLPETLRCPREREWESQFEELDKAQEEESNKNIHYTDMLLPDRSQFHPTMITIMGQVNQALTRYGAVSVYGPQIFEFLGFRTRKAELLALGNYISYFLLMTLAWLSIDVYGRQIYSSSARAQGSAVSVVIWGLANFAVTLLTPIGFNKLEYWLFFVFAITNCIAGVSTWAYSPESGGRSFEENQEFFASTQEDNTWAVRHVDGGRFKSIPKKLDSEGEDRESAPLLSPR